MCKGGFSEKAARLYESGHSLNEISDNLGVRYSSLRKTLIENGVAIRPRAKWKEGLARGVAPYGFVAIAGRLVEDPREQQILQRILSLWRSGKSYHAVAQILNGQGVRPRKAKTWRNTTIESIVSRYEKT